MFIYIMHVMVNKINAAHSIILTPLVWVQTAYKLLTNCLQTLTIILLSLHKHQQVLHYNLHRSRHSRVCSVTVLHAHDHYLDQEKYAWQEVVGCDSAWHVRSHMLYTQQQHSLSSAHTWRARGIVCTTTTYNRKLKGNIKGFPYHICYNTCHFSSS